MKTFIRWSGNKRKLKKDIIPLIPTSYNTYIEPFLGSGSIFLSVKPEKWIINDINEDLISVWQAVQKNPDRLIQYIKDFGNTFNVLPIEGKKRFLNEVAKELNVLRPCLRRTTYFLLMKFCSYMGIIMKNGKFVFPAIDLEYLHFSKNKIPQYFKDAYFDNLKKTSSYLKQNGTILKTDYKNVLMLADKGDFVFLDPPYVENHQYKFNYNKDETLDEKFILDLAKELKKLDLKGVKWLMTQANTHFIRNTFKKYDIIQVRVYRPARKQYTTELLIRNYK